MKEDVKVILLGAVNSGKSTLFKVLTNQKGTLVGKEEGLTRDIKEAPLLISGKKTNIIIIDTAGIQNIRKKDISIPERKVWDKIKEIHIAILIISVERGVSPQDEKLFKEIKKTGKKILLVINKCDDKRENSSLVVIPPNLFKEEIIYISALHIIGINKLRKKIMEMCGKDIIFKKISRYNLNITIIGGPNSGKSTLLNSLLNKEAMITSKTPGTTRDSVSFEIIPDEVQITDTAGIRRKSRIKGYIEKSSVSSSIKSMKISDSVLLLLDPSKGITRQDMNLANIVTRNKKILLIVINKKDLIKEPEEYFAKIHLFFLKNFEEIKKPKIMMISALTKQGIDRIIPEFRRLKELNEKKIESKILHSWLMNFNKITKPFRRIKGKKPKIIKIIQTSSSPLEFSLVANEKKLPRDFLNFFRNNLVKDFNIEECSVSFNIKTSV